MVPTTILVAQQAAVLRRHVNAGVSAFIGARKVEPWTKEHWLQEISYASFDLDRMRRPCVELQVCTCGGG